MSFDKRFPGIYDWEMWVRLAMHSPAGYLAARDAGYRVHLVQESTRNRNGEQVLRLLDHAEEHARRTSFEIRLTDKDARRIRSFLDRFRSPRCA
jgi:hypothetical protein